VLVRRPTVPAQTHASIKRYGMICTRKVLLATWRRLQRPLHFPIVQAGGVCPRSQVDGRVDFRSYGVGPGIGEGPVYPAPFSPDSTQQLNEFTVPAGWVGGKNVFLTLPPYRVLIRSSRLDRPGKVLFASNEIPGAPTLSSPQPTLRLPAFRSSRVARTFFLLNPPGCYAYQIDGTTFSKSVVFEVKI
jgi:hypothetical protein